jgi:biotin carboxyl carrier protein
VLAKANGKVKAVHFAEGDQVDTESPIIELDVEEEG